MNLQSPSDTIGVVPPSSHASHDPSTTTQLSQNAHEEPSNLSPNVGANDERSRALMHLDDVSDQDNNDDDDGVPAYQFRIVRQPTRSNQSTTSPQGDEDLTVSPNVCANDELPPASIHRAHLSDDQVDDDDNNAPAFHRRLVQQQNITHQFITSPQVDDYLMGSPNVGASDEDEIASTVSTFSSLSLLAMQW